jgi:hypothetical protein
MRDLLSLDPKIHGLRTHTKEARRLSYGERVLRIRAAALEDFGDCWMVVAERRVGFDVNVHGVLLRGRRGARWDQNPSCASDIHVSI